MVLVLDSWASCHLRIVTSIGVDIYPTVGNWHQHNNNNNKTTLDHYLFLHRPSFLFCPQGISLLIADPAIAPYCISKCCRVCGSGQTKKVVVAGWCVRGGKSHCCPVLGSVASGRSRCHSTWTGPTCCHVNINNITKDCDSPLLDELSFHSTVQSSASSKNSNDDDDDNTAAGGMVFGLLSVLSDASSCRWGL